MVEINLTKLFNEPKVIGIIGNINTGKSNLVYYLLEELNRKYNLNVFTYGLRYNYPSTKTFHSVAELEQIQDSLIIIEEMSTLFDLENRKEKRKIENTLRLIFHNNNILIISGCGENYKKFISAKLNVMIFKKVTFADLINGSSAKNVIMGYQGDEKGSAVLNLAIDEALVYDGLHYEKVNVPYLRTFDTKIKNVQILVSKKAEK